MAADGAMQVLTRAVKSRAAHAQAHEVELPLVNSTSSTPTSNFLTAARHMP